ncbi:ComEA family DNA-binding protein [Arthrobacter sp. SDTb3-6]|uniref:ComEA family DNA-binding protein n=1 Tax=Arthrobacter sp. SDTb3-6 TaxID=2713571 RepID=UPI00159D3EE0|nr:ComEA family DNA-binding protein [Arthrobacter sp. SDTb3-6]NVM97946.1 hypothetical protein [Arthrobacter sp. SDTb3-6]
MEGERHQAAWTPGTGGTGRGTPEGRGPRWITSLRALVVLLAMAVAVTGVLWLEQAGTSAAAGRQAAAGTAGVAVPPLGREAAPATAPAAGASPPAAQQSVPTPMPPEPPGKGAVIVHVAGAVQHPGVYALPAGSRVLQAVQAAGGALPGAVLDALNLAAPAVDGTQVRVPTRAEAGPAGGVGAVGGGVGGAPGGSDAGTAGGPGTGSYGTGSGGPHGGLVDLNTATAAQLDALPGVGPVLAGRIVAWRTDHGPFTSVDALDAVSGIGAKLLANIRPLVTAR